MKPLLVFGSLFISTSAFACITCNKQIREGIWNSQFYPNLLTMLSAFIVLTIAVIILSAFSAKQHHKRVGANTPSPVPLTTTAMILGIGLGGFVDASSFTKSCSGTKCYLQKFLPPTM